MLSLRGQKKIKTGHPWLTADDISQKSKLPRHPALMCFEGKWWLCSPESYLKLRRFGPIGDPDFPAGKAPPGATLDGGRFRSVFGPWLRLHFQKTLEQKIAALGIDTKKEDLCLRWIFSENDYVPGLIVDIFGQSVAVQINSAPIEMFWFEFRSSLEDSFKNLMGFSPQILELRTALVRHKEGLEIIPFDGEPATIPLNWNGLKWWMTPGGSQKTGSYFDQRTNHIEAAQFAKSLGAKSAWDICSYEGGFALQLLKHGLEKVLAVDQSEDALAVLNKNCALNDMDPDRLQTEKADMFEFLKRSETANADLVDFIVLDPPSLVKGRDSVQPALKALKDLNLLAMKKIKAGGGLVSCVCSHHFSEKAFLEALNAAAVGANRKIKIKKILGPAADHAPAKNFPEGRYLQAAFIEIS